jgi:hypothetical protein
MLMEVRAIGRKTPGDGRLEVTDATWRRLSIVGNLSARVGEVTAPATLERMGCTRCKGHEAAGHDHPFVRSEAFRLLVAGEHCALELHGAELVVARPHSLAPDAPR